MTLKLSTPHFISKVSALLQLDRRDYLWLGVLIALAIVVQGGMLQLQFSTPDGDFVAHVRIARRIVEEGVLEGPHIVYHVIVNTLTLVIGDRTTAGFLVVLAAQVVLLPIIYCLLRPVLPNTAHAALQTAVFTAGLVFVAPIALPTLAENNFYFGYVVANAIHSPTTNVLKPFALGVLVVTLAGLSNRLRFTFLTWLGVTLLVTLCLFTKPNYMLSLLPALILAVGYRFWRGEVANTKLIVSAVIVPTILLLIAQYALGFSDAEAGIAFAPFSVVGHLTGYGIPQLILMFFLSILFPLLVVLSRWQTARRDVGLVASWLAFLAGAVQMYFLSETGVRQWHGNFWWSAQITLFVLFVYSAVFHLRAANQHPSRFDKLITGVFGLHVVFGVLYYIVVFSIPTKYY